MPVVESPATSLPEQIANALPAMIAYVDCDQRYRFVNKAYENWFCLSQAELAGQTVKEVLGDEAYADVRQHVEAALAGEARRFEAMVPYRKGAPRRVEAQYVPDRAPDGRVLGYYGLVIDRSDTEARARIAELLDVFEDGFFALDREWRVTYCNHVAETFGRFKRLGMLGRIAPMANDAMEALLRKVMTEREADQLEVTSVLNPGAILSVRAFPIETGIGVSFRDVTDERRRLQREREQAAHLTELERRRSFLLDLTDVLHSLEDPDALMAEVAARLGRFMQVDRAGYGEIDADGNKVIGYRDWTNGQVASLAGGRGRMDNFGPELINLLRRGVVTRVDDVATDPRAGSHLERYSAIDVGAVLVAPHTRHGRLDAVLYLHSREPRAWTDEDAELVLDVASRTWSALARARSERALRESEARFRAMADSAPAPVWMTGVEGGIEFVNQPFIAIAGKSVEQLLGDTWLELLHPDDLPQVAQLRAAARKTQSPYAFDARFRVAGDQWRWLRASSQPRFNGAGVFQGYVGMAVDITDSRAADERRHLLINELNHRVKNTLATVQSLAHQTLRDGVAPREARDRFTERLLALSAAHNVLTRENWEGAEVGEIVADATRPYGDASGARIEMEGPRIRVAPNVALALSMALHELATNAVKYGALSRPEGKISISWSLGDPAQLTWRETDGPPVTQPERAGFGSRLLRQGLATELGAPAAVEYDVSGVVCRLRVPIAP